jgi:hypothetical protein
MGTKVMTHAELLANIAKAGCSFRWNYPVIKMDRAQIRTCCQVSTNEQITIEQMESQQKEIFLNSDYLVARKIEMLEGKNHADCGPCWMPEKDNFPSMRGTAHPLASFLALQPNKESYSEEDLKALATIQKPRILELQLDNICDLACIYCNPGYSTTWEKKMGVKTVKPPPAEVERFQNLFWDWYQGIFFELNGLCIIGGEPLASPQFFPTLKRLHEIHSSNLDKIKKQQFLSITTNFNTRPEIFARFLELLDLLKTHFNLSINGSCEAIGERAEFIREGLDWNKFNVNARALAQFMKKTKETGHTGRVDFSIHAAQNALSISSLPELLQWAGELEHEVGIAVNLIQNIVSYPAYLSAQAILPRSYTSYCDKAIEMIKSHQVKLRYVDGANWEQYAHFLDNIRKGLESREPDRHQTHEFKRWLSGLSPERQSQFSKLYPDLMSQVVLN